MISWIQKYFQHHFRTIFAVLLAVIIISFVFTIGASPGIGSGERRVIDRQFFGYNLSLAGDQQRLMGDAGLSASLQVGSSAGLGAEQIQNYAFQRAATLHFADQWHIPAPTTAEIIEAIKSLRMFAGQDGQFDAKTYATFQDNLKTNPRGLTAADVARVISDDIRADKVNKLLAGPGYVLPGDVKNQLIRADTTWTLATATVDYAAFNPDLKPTDADLTSFFEQAGGRYEIPPRVVASYLEFPAANHLASVTVTDAEVRAFYDANPTRFPKPADSAKPAATDAAKPAEAPKVDPAADFAAVRAQVEAALKAERAQRLALKTASDLALALFESKATTLPAVDSFLSVRKLTPKSLAPFTRESGAAELGGSLEVTNEAFKLNQGRVASDAISTPSGAVILFWKETQPARKPLFAEVREKVSTDYAESEKRRRFVELGKSVKTQIEARLKAGDALDKAADTAAGGAGLKVTSKSIPPFTLRDRPQDIDYVVLGALERLEKGQVSDMIISADKGLFVHAIEKKMPDLTEASPRYTETRNQVAGYTARMGATAYITEVVERELKKSSPKTE
jgi:peptidyl-prolyl cis-trans isomerase D